MEVNVCIPTLNNYEGLEKCIESVLNSGVPSTIWIVDNGGRFELKDRQGIVVHSPGFNIGVAASWNWFIDNVPNIRIICNDDVEFCEGTLRSLVEGYEEYSIVFPTNLDSKNAFSCFILPDGVVEKVGKFDETISPRYAYFEDNDYHRRMTLAGLHLTGLPLMTRHFGSATMRKFSSSRLEEHHRKFRLARENYKKKWGGEPDHETYTTPFGKQA